MPSPGRGLPRLLRGAVLAGLCLVMSLAGHVAGGGRPDLSPSVIAMTALLAAGCVAAADRQRGLGGIVAVVGISQVLFHLLCAGSEHAGTPGAAVIPGAGMIVAHVLAGVVVSVGLAHGERLAWSLVALCGVLRAVVLVRWCPGAVPAVSAVPSAGRVISLRCVFPRSGPAWRGPPTPSF